MTIKAPSVPPLPDDLLLALRRMRMPFLRAAAQEVLVTAKAQRWDPAVVLRVLIAEEGGFKWTAQRSRLVSLLASYSRGSFGGVR